MELPLAAALGLRDRRSIAAVACVSLLTNPLLNYVGLLLAQVVDWPATPGSALGFIVPAEIVVVLVEWRLLVWTLGGSTRRLFLVTAIMNAASALAGIVFWLV